MKINIQEKYDNECPDCFKNMDHTIEHEMNSKNCGHVFFDENKIDQSCVDPIIDDINLNS